MEVRWQWLARPDLQVTVAAVAGAVVRGARWVTVSPAVESEGHVRGLCD